MSRVGRKLVPARGPSLSNPIYALLAAVWISACSAPRPEAPPGALEVTITVGEAGFWTAGSDPGMIELPAGRDISLTVIAERGIASFSVPDHNIRVLCTENQPGRLVFRSLGCHRAAGCTYQAVGTLGPSDVRRGRVRLMPEDQAR